MIKIIRSTLVSQKICLKDAGKSTDTAPRPKISSVSSLGKKKHVRTTRRGNSTIFGVCPHHRTLFVKGTKHVRGLGNVILQDFERA